MPRKALTGNQSDFLKIVCASAGRGDIEAVRHFVNENPAWINTIGSHGRTMIWEAVYRGKMKVVEFLLDRGADINACGCYNIEHFIEISPYCVAKSKGRKEIAKYLLKKGAVIDIHSVAYLGNSELIISFLDKIPELVNRGHPQSVMLRTGFEYQDAPWATPLHYSVSGGQKEATELLVSRGGEIRQHSQRLLDYAVDRNRVDLVRILLENGADPGKSPQVYRDEGEIYELLKSYGVEPADPNEPAQWPDLIYSSRGDKGEHPEKIERLLKLGADVNIRNYKGKTALHVAAKAGFVKVMKVLLDNNADVNAIDNNGETPLFDTISSTLKDTSRKISAVEVLLSYKADPHFENYDGLTPIKLAQNSRRKEAIQIVKMLREIKERKL